MDQAVSREKDHTIDIGTGGSGSTSEEDANSDHVPRIRQVQNLLCRVWSGVVSFDGSIKGEDGISSPSRVTGSAEVTIENAELVADKKSGGEETKGLLDQKEVKENRKKTSPKWSPKPPRPPRGPSLDAADQKLIKEISELIMLKRARNERIKAMKKMKAAKASSSSSNAGLFAMIFTMLVLLLFFLLPGRGSHGNFNGSPEPSSAKSGGLISVQYYKNLSAAGSDESVSSSPNYIEQVSGYSSQRKREALEDETKYSRKDK